MPPSTKLHTTVSSSRNLKTALMLASVAVVFFIGVIVRHWIWA